MTENNNDEPKIIVDEDWKEQVQQEKEQLQKTEHQEQPEEPVAGELPPASFLTLLSMLGAQAMSGLGIMPDPTTGQPHVNRPLAKHCIDTIGILQDKTKGNLSEDEAAHIRDALHQLRMLYVSTSKQPAPTTESGDSGESSSSSELP